MSELVEVDVIVTDKGDHPRTDLGPEDFEVLEDGQPQPITHFARGFTAASVGHRPSTASPGITAFPDEGIRRGRHVVLAVDDYHLESSDLATVRKALLRCIDEQMQSGDEVAVVAASGSLGPLQQFTTDREVLRRAVGRLQVQNRSFLPRSPTDVPHLTDYQAELIEAGDEDALELAAREVMAAQWHRADPGSGMEKPNQEIAGRRVRALAREIVSNTSRATRLTLSSLEHLLASLAPLRGRKVVALFSSGFFLGPDRQSSRGDLEVIANAAMRAGVVIYAVDARGLIATTAIGDATAGGTYDLAASPGTRERIGLSATEASRAGMSALAADTGGLALFDRNDLGGALKQVMEDSASYYRLGYQPQASRDGRFPKVEVRVPTLSGLRIRTASAYRARAAGEATGTAAASEKAASDPKEAAARLLRAALDSLFEVRGLPVDLAADFVAAKNEAEVVLTALVDAGQLGFHPTPEGREGAALDIIGTVVDETGKAIGQFSDRVELSLTAEAKARAIANGLTYRKAFTVKPGLLQARIAVREDESGLLGSTSQWVQVPDRSKQALVLSSILVVGEGESPAAVRSAAGRGVVSFDRSRRAEVSRRFPRGGHLDYLLMVYGRAKPGPASPVEIERQLFYGNVLLTKSAPTRLTGESPDGARAEGGRLRLDAFSPGDYELRIVATDTTTRATATRSLSFIVE